MSAIIKDLKKGTFFRFSNSETSPVWIRGEYVRELKKYSITKFEDTNCENFVSPTKVVFIDFEF